VAIDCSWNDSDCMGISKVGNYHKNGMEFYKKK
jgi:hypothetical protein